MVESSSKSQGKTLKVEYYLSKDMFCAWKVIQALFKSCLTLGTLRPLDTFPKAQSTQSDIRGFTDEVWQAHSVLLFRIHEPSHSWGILD